MNRRYILSILIVGVIDVAAVVLGPLLSIQYHNDVTLSIAYGIVGTATFLGLLPIVLDGQTKFGFRELIATSFSIAYLILVMATAFMHKKLPVGNLTQQLVS